MNAAVQYSPARILVAEMGPEVRECLQLAVFRSGYVLDFVEDGGAVLNALVKGFDFPSLVILDGTRPNINGLALVKSIRQKKPGLPVIVLSEEPVATNLEAAAEGETTYFLTKSVSHEELRKVIDKLLRSTPVIPNSKGVAASAKPQLNPSSGYWGQEIEPVLQGLALYDVPILLQGETGVGKEVLARHIHNNSLRAGKIFLKLNCAALPSELVESELFGYERGAFTGAFRSNPGKFQLADGGTILLDEIGDMDLRLQAKLLQVLQDREFFRIGAKEATHVDVRVIAATHRDLEALIEDGNFREDLYYRLNVINISIPPLRERLDEVISLASFFLRKHAGDGPIPEIGHELSSALQRHSWPGNIRELENIMRRYLVMRNSRAIVEELDRINGNGVSRKVPRASRIASEPAWFAAAAAASAAPSFSGSPIHHPRSHAALPPAPIPQSSSQPTQIRDSKLAKLDHARRAAEADVILNTLHSTQWNRKRAASLLGIDYKALLYKMKKLKIE